jgi:hypothetical protein
LGNGNAVHVLYNNEYTGLGYNVALQEIKPNGKMRLFDATKGKWKFILNEDEEENYIKEIKKSEKEIVEEDWSKYPHGIYGYRDKKDKFKIKVKPDEGQKPTRGSVCLEASWNKQRLYSVMNNIDALPDKHNDFDKLNRSQLLSLIKAQPEFSPFVININNRSDDDLRKILTLKKMLKKDICVFLEGWFKKHKMYVEMV